MSARAESTGNDAVDAALTPLDAAPVMRVITGSPTADELAAAHAVITAVLAAQASEGATRLAPHADEWTRGARQMRGLLSPGPGAWGASRGARGC